MTADLIIITLYSAFIIFYLWSKRYEKRLEEEGRELDRQFQKDLRRAASRVTNRIIIRMNSQRTKSEFMKEHTN